MHRRQLIFAGSFAALSPSLFGPERAVASRRHAAGDPGPGHELINGDEDASMRHDRDQRFIATPFGRIACIDRGSGPCVLFLHGFPLSSFQWRGAIDRLSGERRCLAPDFMGLGRTQVAPGQGVAPADQVEMLVALLDHLRIDRVDLVANDSGGAVAQLIAVAHPERVRTMLLTNCDVETNSPPPALLPVIELAREGRYADAWLQPWLDDKALARSSEGLGGLCYSDPANPTDAALEQYLRPLVESQARKDLVHAYTLGLTPNPLAGIESSLRELRAPVGIVWGMADAIFSPRDPDYLASVLPGSIRIRRIAQGKLFFPEEYPDVIVDEARALWRRTDAA
jgi:pimeloyl-ACP methyl ester carboxylesterase